MPGWLIRHMRRDEVLVIEYQGRVVAQVTATTKGAAVSLGVRAHPVFTLRQEAAPAPEQPPWHDPSSSTRKP